MCINFHSTYTTIVVFNTATLNYRFLRLGIMSKLHRELWYFVPDLFYSSVLSDLRPERVRDR